MPAARLAACGASPHPLPPRAGTERRATPRPSTGSRTPRAQRRCRRLTLPDGAGPEGAEPDGAGPGAPALRGSPPRGRRRPIGSSTRPETAPRRPAGWAAGPASSRWVRAAAAAALPGGEPAEPAAGEGAAGNPAAPEPPHPQRKRREPEPPLSGAARRFRAPCGIPRGGARGRPAGPPRAVRPSRAGRAGGGEDRSRHPTSPTPGAFRPGSARGTAAGRLPAPRCGAAFALCVGSAGPPAGAASVRLLVRAEGAGWDGPGESEKRRAHSPLERDRLMQKSPGVPVLHSEAVPAKCRLPCGSAGSRFVFSGTRLN